MSLLVADNVHLAFGSKTILDAATFTIGRRDRLGVIGPNGTGKSTLLRLLMGTMEPDNGRIVRTRGVRIGYLPQDVQEIQDAPLLEVVLAAAPGRDGLTRRLDETQAELAGSADTDEQMELSETLYHLHEELDRFETMFATHEAEKILVGLGFRERDFSRPLHEFSGGWKMRAILAGLLFTQPDLMLLDEPTNHLDVPSLLWFEKYLKDYGGAFLLISHDREFLNRQIERVLSFEVEGLRSYTGDFESYLELREQELELLEARAKNQERMIAQNERFIQRFRYKATKARQVQSRVKRLEKLERIELPNHRRTLDFEFAPTPRSGREAIRVVKLDKAFGDNVLFRKLDLTVLRQERIAIVGRNGAGKTTLLRMIAGELNPDAGAVEIGHNVAVAYYAQHHSDQLSQRLSILQEVQSVDPSAGPTRVRTICGVFLFSGDDVDKSCAVLSGGEKARVVLAKLLMKPGNLLLMDEPTNHLDLYSTEALMQALETYDGTLLFVSHNRAFINRLATTLWDLDGTGVTIYPGNLDDYEYHLAQKAARAAAPTRVTTQPDSRPAERGSRKDERRAQAQRIEERNKALRPVKRAIEELEGRIAALEAEQKDLETKLADPEFDGSGEAGEATRRYRQNMAKIEELMARWEHRQEDLAKTSARFEIADEET
ncbi:MAG: ABC-F family ATP-binding cassette domain-containing protein [Deltaproteobacteria bacterium]|nr:ABC-F family ATP-binding cassette domain-containing protein [Deltaproteobacteria bacterium]